MFQYTSSCFDAPPRASVQPLVLQSTPSCSNAHARASMHPLALQYSLSCFNVPPRASMHTLVLNITPRVSVHILVLQCTPSRFSAASVLQCPLSAPRRSPMHHLVFGCTFLCFNAPPRASVYPSRFNVPCTASMACASVHSFALFPIAPPHLPPGHPFVLH